MQTNYREPWRHVCGHDTHNVKRDKEGRMLGTVTMGLDDYDRACACVNALVGMDPEAVADVIDALENIVSDLDALKRRDDRAVGLDRIESWFSVLKARRTLKALKGES